MHFKAGDSELISNRSNYVDQEKVLKLVFELSKAIGFCGMVGGQQGDIDFTTMI